MTAGAQEFASMWNRAAACRAAGLHPDLGPRLQGSTREELESDALSIAQSVAATAPKPRAVPADAIAGRHTPQPGPPVDGAILFAALVHRDLTGRIDRHTAQRLGLADHEPEGRGNLIVMEMESVAAVEAAARGRER